MAETNFLLYLKALVWSVFVSYTESTVTLICNAVRSGNVSGVPEFQDSHLGDCLRYIVQELPNPEHRQKLADCLPNVKKSMPSRVYQNMVIEVGHYVMSEQDLGDVPDDCPGVVYCLGESSIHVLFRTPGKTLTARTVHPFQIMPVYTLTVPDKGA